MIKRAVLMAVVLGSVVPLPAGAGDDGLVRLALRPIRLAAPDGRTADATPVLEFATGLQATAACAAQSGLVEAFVRVAATRTGKALVAAEFAKAAARVLPGAAPRTVQLLDGVSPEEATEKGAAVSVPLRRCADLPAAGEAERPE